MLVASNHLGGVALWTLDRSAFPFEIRELCSLKDQSKYLLPATCGVNILLEEV